MAIYGVDNQGFSLEEIGDINVKDQYWNLTPTELVERAISQNMGVLADNGALVVSTGEFTGRCPKDRFIVKDALTSETVDWGDVNKPFDTDKFDALLAKMLKYVEGKDLYVRDVFACADPSYKLNVRVLTEYPWQNLFVSNMFLDPNIEELTTITPEWHVISIPSFMANPEEDGTKRHNFAIINFDKKMILIGGTAYTGEIKKGIFSVLNYVLPHDKNVLSMHCSANQGAEGDTAIFFGLSGTGKTTLSADPNRQLIGDDEHGWTNHGVFNFEGGCYAKCIDLSPEGEPQIYNAIRSGALLENIVFEPGTRNVDYGNSSITENTRVSYPIEYINNAIIPSVGDVPKNIFFLTCDAFGVLPPISKLTPGQAMYHFISGYTAKVAGTEEGITEPQTTFSACFGAPFLPLHPTKYAEMLGKKIEEQQVNVWLINTGWTGGPYGTGNRIKLQYTRAIISAALEGKLDHVEYTNDSVFGLAIPKSCENVPYEILDPKNTWEDKQAFDVKASQLAQKFVQNFEKFASDANWETLAAAPKVTVQV